MLLPEGIGERASERRGVTGSPTLPTEGFVRRPNLVGALVVKAAAHTNPGDRDPRRHRRDFVVLAGLITARDFAAEELGKKDRQRLRSIVAAVRADRELLVEIPEASEAVNRLVLTPRLEG